MDSLTTSLPPNFHHHKKHLNPATHRHPSHQLHLLTHHHHNPTTSPTQSLYKTTKPPKDNFTPLYSHHSPKYPSLNFKPPRRSHHRRASSGYAAALLDTAQSHGVVLEVANDVERLLKVMVGEGCFCNFVKDEGVDEKIKGNVLRVFLEEGKFNGFLVELVKLVIHKGKKVDFISEILLDFRSILDQLVLNPTVAY